MKAVTKILGGGVAAAALGCAAPAAAQYYPGYGYGQGYANGYGMNQQAAVNQCVGAVQQRLGGGYNGYGYNNNGYGGGRVLGISRVEPRQEGGVTVRGVATAGAYGGYGYNNQPNLTWRCRTDYRGFVIGVDINRAYNNGYAPYGNGYAPGYSPYGNDYSQYGYRRY